MTAPKAARTPLWIWLQVTWRPSVSSISRVSSIEVSPTTLEADSRAPINAVWIRPAVKNVCRATSKRNCRGGPSEATATPTGRISARAPVSPAMPPKRSWRTAPTVLVAVPSLKERNRWSRTP